MLFNYTKTMNSISYYNGYGFLNAKRLGIHKKYNQHISNAHVLYWSVNIKLNVHHFSSLHEF